MSGPGSITEQVDVPEALRQHRERIRGVEAPSPGKWIYVLPAPFVTPPDFIPGSTLSPSFQNGWGNVNGQQGVSFRQHPATRVALRGAIQGGQIPSIVFTLPANYRPAFSQPVTLPGSDGSVYVGRVDPTGDVWILSHIPIPTRYDWFLQTTPTFPNADGGAMALDAPASRVILSGGGAGANETWSWHGFWTKLTPAASPSARGGQAQAYFPGIGIILFGGQLIPGGTYNSETWLWASGNWTQLTPAHHPTGRSLHAMAFDPNLGKVVLVGGYDGTNYLNDTWAYDGSDWTQIVTTRAPIGHAGNGWSSAMLTRISNGNLRSFGGLDSGGVGDDEATWDFTGSNWFEGQAFNPQPYAYGQGNGAAFHRNLNLGLAVGVGTIGDPSNAYTFLEAGSGWATQSPQTSLGGRLFPIGASEDTNGDVVLFGMNDTTGALQTWIYKAALVSAGVPHVHTFFDLSAT